MANRLSVIATRTGDDGTTGLGDGSRIPKDAPPALRHWATSMSSTASLACC